MMDERVMSSWESAWRDLKLKQGYVDHGYVPSDRRMQTRDDGNWSEEYEYACGVDGCQNRERGHIPSIPHQERAAFQYGFEAAVGIAEQALSELREAVNVEAQALALTWAELGEMHLGEIAQVKRIADRLRALAVMRDQERRTKPAGYPDASD